MSKGYVFNIELDGGRETTVTVLTSIYQHVAAALPALLAKSLPFDAFVWHEPAGKTNGHRFRIRENEFGQLVVETLVPAIQQRMGDEK